MRWPRRHSFPGSATAKRASGSAPASRVRGASTGRWGAPQDSFRSGPFLMPAIELPPELSQPLDRPDAKSALRACAGDPRPRRLRRSTGRIVAELVESLELGVRDRSRSALDHQKASWQPDRCPPHTPRRLPSGPFECPGQARSPTDPHRHAEGAPTRRRCLLGGPQPVSRGSGLPAVRRPRPTRPSELQGQAGELTPQPSPTRPPAHRANRSVAGRRQRPKLPGLPRSIVPKRSPGGGPGPPVKKAA